MELQFMQGSTNKMEQRMLGLICHLLSLFLSEIQTGLPVMTETPLVAIELQLKIIAYEDDQKKVWLAYNEAKYIEER